MAIVPMKRLAVVAPGTRREELLGQLQELGVLHLVPHGERAEPPLELQARRQALQRLLHALHLRHGKARRRPPAAGAAPLLLPPGHAVSPETDEELARRAEAALARLHELQLRLVGLYKEEDLALPWGRATAGELALLRDKGLRLAAWRGQRRAAEQLALPAGVWRELLSLPRGRRNEVLLLCAAFAELPDPGPGFEPLPPPTRPRPAIGEEIARLRQEQAAAEAELDGLTRHLDALRRVEARLADRLRLAEARAGAVGDQDVFGLEGWCPAERLAGVRELVVRRGGGVLLAEPGPAEEPPVAVRNGPLVRFFEPLLKAFQLPSYREPDPTPFIAPFMALFFAFCLGDAGYGLVLCLLATLLGRRLGIRGGEALKAVRLMQLLGVCTVVIGLLTGIVFGVPLYQLDWLAGALGLSGPEELRGKLLFFLSAESDKFFYASLLFGVVQLSLGISIRLVRNLLLGRVQAALASLGWLAVLPGVGAWYLFGIQWFFVAALLAIFLFATPSSRVLRRLGGGVWALYNVTGLFGDVMSYVRIFGLGLSSGIIAMVVNTIAMNVKDSIPGVGWLCAALVLLVGHTFNFLMATIGSVVHPARLQFLEFFGRFFEGGGQPYAPFSRSAASGPASVLPPTSTSASTSGDQGG